MSTNALLIRSLRYGALVALVVAVVAGVIGYLVSGTPGVVGALVGTGVSAFFLGLTAISMLLAGRVVKGDASNPVYFAVVVGVVGLKFVVFLVLVLWLRGQDWLDLGVFGASVVAGVIGSLVADVVAFARTRIPHVGDVPLPGEERSKP
ncbi:MAG TPA: hypothetical protein VNR36_09650 [Pseudolysinimonas sp.]|nr:hypothetical protein [Pseudolysinimonas sp.]